MARTVNQILTQMQAELAAQPSLSGSLNTPSKVSIYGLWMYIIAVSIALFEQVLDIYKAAIEAMIGKAGVGTLPWIRDRILEFQAGYNVTYNNGAVSYATIDTTARIITRASVSQGGNKTVNIKVAKSEPPQALTSGELQEIQYYAKQITFAGTQISLISLSADFLYVNAEMFYDGQLPVTTVTANVIAAMNAYCDALSSADNFDGSIVIPAIEVALLNTVGVKYIKLNEVAFRAATVPFASRQILYSLSGGIDTPKTSTISGYLVGDTDSGHTFNDSFTYTVAM